jgi:hypothetical protein
MKLVHLHVVSGIVGVLVGATAQELANSALGSPDAARAAAEPAPNLTREHAEILNHLSLVHVGDGTGRLLPTLRISGVNVQIVNGLEATNGYPVDPFEEDPELTETNGLGNLIVGYNEPGQPDGDLRTGSHNVVVGTRHNFTSFGGLVVALENAITAPYAAVSGGVQNVASAKYASVSGGVENQASGAAASVLGGMKNVASHTVSGVVGGLGNNARERYAVVCGGEKNAAEGPYACVGGGRFNSAAGFYASVAGGEHNVASNYAAAVSGGDTNIASGTCAWIGGGRENVAFGEVSSVGGGSANEANGPYDCIAGGCNQTTAEDSSCQRP